MARRRNDFLFMQSLRTTGLRGLSLPRATTSPARVCRPKVDRLHRDSIRLPTTAFGPGPPAAPDQIAVGPRLAFLSNRQLSRWSAVSRPDKTPNVRRKVVRLLR